MNKYEYAIKKMEIVQDLVSNRLENEGNVISGICGVTDDVKAITKDRKVQSKSVNYMFRSVEDAQSAMNPLFPKHNISITEVLLWHTVQEKSVEKEYNQKKYTQTSYYHLAEYMYIIQSSVDGSKTVVITMGECNESSDKGVGKTSSYAWKNMVLKTFCVPVENALDPDRENNPMKPAQSNHPKLNDLADHAQVMKMVAFGSSKNITPAAILGFVKKQDLSQITNQDLKNIKLAWTEKGFFNDNN